MCAPKSKGGKRCLKHQSATSAITRLTEAKTGLDRETVYETLKELNKEGRKLDAPTLKEVKEFLNKEEFVVKHDPELSERDRKLILKNLQKAKDEAEKQGVTGGAFHAWKNLLKRSISKIKKPLIGIAAVGVLAFSLSGCSGSQTEPVKSPNPTSSSQPAAACANEELGDVVATKEVKDDKGEYCAVELDSNAAILKQDKSKWDEASLKANGVSDEQAQTAVDTIAKFYASEGLDSTIVDSTDNNTTDAWMQKNASKYIDPEWVSTIEEKPVSSSQFVSNGLTPNLVRDGKARVASEALNLQSVSATKNDKGQTEVVVKFGAKTAYRSSDADLITWVKAHQIDATDASVKEKYPYLADGKESKAVAEGNLQYSVNVANNKITGFSYGNSWSLEQ